MTATARLRSSEAGFSAVEMIVAVAFFGVLMLGFVGVFPMGLRTVEKSERMSVATTLAQDEFERLKTLPFNHADLLAGAHADADNPIQGAYTRTWTVTDDDPLPEMKRVDMNVAFSDGGIPRNVTMSVYLNP